MGEVSTRIFKKTIEAAATTEGIKRYKLGASLFDKRGRVVVSKGNSRKTHPLQLKFSRYPYLHAEAHAIISYGLDNCKGLNLFVTRTDSAGNSTMARPCPSCLALAKYVGIESIYYTDWKGSIVHE